MVTATLMEGGTGSATRRPSKLGLEFTVDETGRNLVISKIIEGGPAARDQRLKIGDRLVSVEPLSPDTWIASASAGVAASTQKAPQTLESVRAALKSDAQGTWVVVVLRKGCDDVVQVELNLNESAEVPGGGARQRPQPDEDVFGGSVPLLFEKQLLAHLVQASAHNKAAWQAKAARVGMPGFGGEFKEHTWEQVWEGPDDEPEEDKLRDPETGLLLKYGTYAQSTQPTDTKKLGRLPLILAGLGTAGAVCLLLHFLHFLLSAVHL